MRYSLYRVDAQNARGAGGLNAPSASAALDNTDQSVSFSSTAAIVLSGFASLALGIYPTTLLIVGRLGAGPIGGP